VPGKLRVASVIGRLESEALALYVRRQGCSLGANPRIHGRPIISLIAGTSLQIGERATLISRSRKTALGVQHPIVLRTLLPSAAIMVGDDVGMSGTSICAAVKITVGDRVLLGANVIIADTDFHPSSTLPRRYAPIPEPKERDAVHIGPDAFVGTGTVILKGSRVGAGATVGAMCTVSGVVLPGETVPAGSVVRRR
jgi:acetyltransferase-like isoleucine patch superfamily enzyme